MLGGALNYYEHHLGDYLRDTAHLSMVEDGAYRRLLDTYYVKEQPIPAELRDACRLVRAASKPERDAVATVLREFFEATPEGWRHKRCDAEIARYQDKQAKARRSAEARWNASKPQCDGNANASTNAHADDMRTHSEGNALQSPVTRHQTPDTKEGTARKRADPPPDRPESVAERTWADWLALRKDKRAKVSETVLAEATAQAEQAGVSLDKFLRSWVGSGWQGYTAKQYREREGVAPRNGHHGTEPAWRTEQRDRMQQAAPYAAARPPQHTTELIEENHAHALSGPVA